MRYGFLDTRRGLAISISDQEQHNVDSFLRLAISHIGTGDNSLDSLLYLCGLRCIFLTRKRSGLLSKNETASGINQLIHNNAYCSHWSKCPWTLAVQVRFWGWRALTPEPVWVVQFPSCNRPPTLFSRFNCNNRRRRRDKAWERD